MIRLLFIAFLSLMLLSPLFHSSRKAAAKAAHGQQGVPAMPGGKALDFWVGTWDVKLRDGKKAGVDRVEVLLKGAAIMEHWKDVDGSEGKSFFYFIPASKQWKQVWVTPAGVYKEKLSEPVEHGVRF